LFGVKPRSRTTALAALRPSDFDSCWVNAGSGAERVVVLVLLDGVDVLAGVLVVVEAVFGGAVAVLCEVGGTLETVTVFVPEPHAASASAAHTHRTDRAAGESLWDITPWYSPPARAFLACREHYPATRRAPVVTAARRRPHGRQAAHNYNY
jgi:hypothetical protein